MTSSGTRDTNLSLLQMLFLLIAFRSACASSFTTPAACPRFVSCATHEGGLGDQLEQYIYCASVAKLLDAEVIIEGFHRSVHRGGDEFHEVATLLGINLRLTTNGVRSLYSSPPLSVTKWISKPDAVILHKAVKKGDTSFPCHIMYASDIRSCQAVGDQWCDLAPTFDSFEATQFRLRRNDAKHECMVRGLGFFRRSTEETVNIAWHVRTGDICLNCDNLTYFEHIFDTLLTVPSIARAHVLAIDSHDKIDWLAKSNMFHHAVVYHTNQKLIDTVCRFITADVLVTSGSSFAPFVAAFLPPWSPVVLEERRKEAPATPTSFIRHFFRATEAILMEGGAIQVDGAEFTSLLDSILRDKLVMEVQHSACRLSSEKQREP